jgi:phosphatidylethanolamine/phosphatidyl-N-methylethanolamine N-methyltransferase
MPDRSQRFYDRFAFVYPVIDLFLTPQKRAFFELIASTTPGRLLEIGVGNGSHLRCYKSHEVIGIDNSSAMLARAKKHRRADIELMQMSGEDLQFQDASFDHVVLSHVIAVVDDPDRLVREVHRVLRPGGNIYILNHVTPSNGLRYIDRAFAAVTDLLKFRSVFDPSSITELQRFTLIHEEGIGLFSYFKILIYEKGV